MKPKSILKQARKWMEELFCWFQVLWQHFIFPSFCIHFHACSFTFLSFACIALSFCIHFLSFSFHSPFMFLSFFLSYSFHIHSTVHSCPFIFLSSSFHLPFNLQACSFHFAFMSFHFLSRAMEMALRLGQGTECNK